MTAPFFIASDKAQPPLNVTIVYSIGMESKVLRRDVIIAVVAAFALVASSASTMPNAFF